MYDDLSDVNLNHPNFRRHFPDGVVPIRCVPKDLARIFHREGDVTEALLQYSDGLADLAPYDVDALAFAREQVLDFEVAGGDCAVDETKRSLEDRKTVIAELMIGGMTLRQIGVYLGWSNEMVVEAVTSADQRDRAEGYVAADEALVLGESVRSTALRFGLSKNVLNGLARIRKGQPYSYDSSRAEAV